MGQIFRCNYCGKEFTREHWEGGYIDHTNFCRNVGNIDANSIIKELEVERSSSDHTVHTQQDKLDSLLKREDIRQEVKDLVNKHFKEKYELLKGIFPEEVIKEFNFYVKDINKLCKFAKEMKLQDKNFEVVYIDNYPKHFLDAKNISIVVDGKGYLLKKITN